MLFFLNVLELQNLRDFIVKMNRNSTEKMREWREAEWRANSEKNRL